MSEGKIKVKIDAFGRPQVEAVGFTGTECTTATAGLEAALGGDVARNLKPEYHETAVEEHETQYERGY